MKFSLHVSVKILRTGELEIEQEFVLSLGEDGEIKRGPILSYLTAYRGFGDLVLDHKMRVQEVWRNGKREPFKVEDYEGMRRIVCGEKDVLPEQGEHRYVIRFVRNGDWIYHDGMAHWAYEITESFKSFPIGNLTFQLQLPEGVELTHYTPALSGSLSADTGYELTETSGGLTIQTTAPLREISGGLCRSVSPLINEKTRPFLVDLNDHSLQARETIEHLREGASGLRDFYLSTVSNRMNEVMKVLTCFSTIFLPLTFIAGIYGMNFEHMPELKLEWGYPAVWVAFVVSALLMLWLFVRKRWI